MDLNIANCPRCGRIFARGIKDVCHSCQKEIEEEYMKCSHYLKENKGCNIHELSDATGVSIRQITKFIREGRISLMDHANMGIPCESCGIMIRSGHLCDSCRMKFYKGIKSLQEREHTDDKGTRLKREHDPTYAIKKGGIEEKF